MPYTNTQYRGHRKCVALAFPGFQRHPCPQLLHGPIFKPFSMFDLGFSWQIKAASLSEKPQKVGSQNGSSGIKLFSSAHFLPSIQTKLYFVASDVRLHAFPLFYVLRKCLQCSLNVFSVSDNHDNLSLSVTYT